jgi:hypothetical protein
LYTCGTTESCFKNLFIVPTDAHYYKIIEMLKQFKIIILAPTCFGSRRNHHQGAVLWLVKTTSMVCSVVVGIDAVNVMAPYQPVVLAWGSEFSAIISAVEGKNVLLPYLKCV